MTKSAGRCAVPMGQTRHHPRRGCLALSAGAKAGVSNICAPKKAKMCKSALMGSLHAALCLVASTSASTCPTESSRQPPSAPPAPSITQSTPKPAALTAAPTAPASSKTPWTSTGRPTQSWAARTATQTEPLSAPVVRATPASPCTARRRSCTWL